MKYGILSYREGRLNFNIGDNIQSLAAEHFLPRVDVFINREEMGSYSGGPTKLILNGWFTHEPKTWVPVSDIDPLFVSFHLNSSAAKAMLSEAGVAYLKRHEPIGCRDTHTVNLLREKEIAAYFTGCLTLTLDHYRVEDEERGEEVFIVDPLYSYPTWRSVTIDPLRTIYHALKGNLFRLHRKGAHLKNIIDAEVLNAAQFRSHVPPSGNYTDREKMAMADALLKEYARARLVITSRLHCALPCLAMGTPVIYLNGFDREVDRCRFDGLFDLMNRVDIDQRTGKFMPNFPINGKIGLGTRVTNPESHRVLALAMKRLCRTFIAN